MAPPSDIAVIGGGLVGAAIAHGLAQGDANTVLLDEGDIAFRAARGNFGNVWVQGKGLASPPYANLSRAAALAWPDFACGLEEETGTDLRFRQDGAYYVCFSAEELERRAAQLKEAEVRSAIPSGFEIASAAELRADFPQIGPAIPGATFTRCGMGPCQGRMCGHSAGEVMAALTGRSPTELGYLRIRMPVKPVTLGDIAGEHKEGRHAA